MPKIKHLRSTEQRRALRVRRKMHGTAERPRLSVNRSNQHTFLQVINDDKGVTIASASDMGKPAAAMKGTKTERATALAQAIVEQLRKLKVSALIFDRGAFRYHGRVKAVAEALREAGLKV